MHPLLRLLPELQNQVRLNLRQKRSKLLVALAPQKIHPIFLKTENDHLHLFGKLEALILIKIT